MKQQGQGLLLIIVISLLQLSALALPKINHEAPDFTVVDTFGKAHKLSNYRGKVVVLEWTNHNCPFVKKHYESGNMQDLQKEFTDRGVVWLSIISSARNKQGFVSNDEANALTHSRRAHPTAVIRDPEGNLGRLFSAKTTPHMYILNQKGHVTYMGAIDSIKSTKPDDVTKAKPYVKDALNNLLAGRKLKTHATQPYGCSIKYSS